MAERRMFAKTIIDSDAFLDLPVAAQALYFHLSMRADDDGFTNKPRAIMNMIGAKDDDMKSLISKKFVIYFDSGVIVIKHWRMHNYIRKDTYSETKYKFEKAQLYLDENNAYSENPQGVDGSYTDCIQDVDGSLTQVRLGKDSIGKDSIGKETRTRMARPTLQEVSDYVQESGYNVNPAEFIDFYESNGWKVGKNPMKDWKAAVRTWNQREPNAPKRVKPSCEPIVIDDAEADRLRNIEKYI